MKVETPNFTVETFEGFKKPLIRLRAKVDKGQPYQVLHLYLEDLKPIIDLINKTKWPN
jgi:hypothetical protein